MNTFNYKKLTLTLIEIVATAARFSPQLRERFNAIVAELRDMVEQPGGVFPSRVEKLNRNMQLLNSAIQEVAASDSILEAERDALAKENAELRAALAQKSKPDPAKGPPAEMPADAGSEDTKPPPEPNQRGKKGGKGANQGKGGNQNKGGNGNGQKAPDPDAAPKPETNPKPQPEPDTATADAGSEDTEKEDS